MDTISYLIFENKQSVKDQDYIKTYEYSLVLYCNLRKPSFDVIFKYFIKNEKKKRLRKYMAFMKEMTKIKEEFNFVSYNCNQVTKELRPLRSLARKKLMSKEQMEKTLDKIEELTIERFFIKNSYIN